MNKLTTLEIRQHLDDVRASWLYEIKRKAETNRIYKGKEMSEFLLYGKGTERTNATVLAKWRAIHNMN